MRLRIIDPVSLIIIAIAMACIVSNENSQGKPADDQEHIEVTE